MAQVSYSSAAEGSALINEDSIKVSVQEPQLESVHGLTVVTTCVFIVGVIAGAGFLSLPKAVDDTGWIGFVFIVACCGVSAFTGHLVGIVPEGWVGFVLILACCGVSAFTGHLLGWIGFVLILACCGVSAFTGHLLGKCWIIVREMQPELKEIKVGDPYPRIGELAYGKAGRRLVSFSIFFTMFGSAIVYILLAAENIRDLLPPRDSHVVNTCYLSLVISAVITPLTWLGSPKDNWGIAAAATLATGTASVILFIAVLDTDTNTDDVQHTNVSVVTFFTGYGIICSAFCGHPAFPTFQSDMKDPSKFGKAILLGYAIVLLMYVPSSAVGYAVFGSDVEANIIGNMAKGPVKTIVSVLMTTHLLFGIIIVLNPVSLGIEHLLGVPNRFTWRRVVTRTVIMVAALFVLESVPHFSSILALVGGSTISILSFICPPLFYMKLAAISADGTKEPVPFHMKVVYVEIMLIGTIAGCAATYSAITDLATNKFTVPCYVDPVKAST